jgi:hypothetical protein
MPESLGVSRETSAVRPPLGKSVVLSAIYFWVVAPPRGKRRCRRRRTTLDMSNDLRDKGIQIANQAVYRRWRLIMRSGLS